MSRSVYLHDGGFELGAALHVRGGRLRAAGFEDVAFESYTDLGNMVPVLHDAVFQRWRTDDPRKAALTLAFVPLPMPPFAPPIAGYSDHDMMREEAQRRQCTMLANVTDSVMALNAATGGSTRRVYVVATDWSMDVCRQLGLERANSFVLELVWDHLQAESDARDRVRQLQVPVLSHVRWSGALDRSGRTPPWMSRHERPVLMSYVGSAQPQGHDSSLGVMPLARQLVTTQCTRLADPKECTTMVYKPSGNFTPPEWWWRRQPPDSEDKLDADAHAAGSTVDSGANVRRDDGWVSPGTRDMNSALELKRQSVFCIEPPGANPVRRSMYDSFLAGCIPVLFMSARDFSAFLPYPFLERRHNMSVRIDPSEMASLDLHAHLRELNHTGRALRMRRAIARHAHRLVYSLDAGYRGDAADAFVEALLARAEAAEAADRYANLRERE